MGHKNKQQAAAKAKAGGGASSSSALPAVSVNFNPKDVTDPFELLDMCVAALHDKRCPAAARESALSSLVGALEGAVPLDEAADGRPLVIFALCGASIKRGAASPAAFGREARLAYRAVGLLALTLRAGGATEILRESFPVLARALRLAAATDPPTVVAALDCLAAVTFAGALGDDEAERSMEVIWAVLFPNQSSRNNSAVKAAVVPAKTSPEVVAAAVSAWTFLATTVAATDARRKAADRAAWAKTIASLAGVLQSEDRAVRMAAGEAVAVCAELNHTQHTPRGEMAAILSRVADLGAEAAGKGTDKHLFLEQKVLFRQISAFLELGEPPRRALRTSSDRRESITVSTWAKMVQLNFLRRFLGGGFLQHVKGNRVFKEAFDVGADERRALSIARRRQSCKLKEKEMKMNREMAWEMKNVYCLPQGGPPESSKPDHLLKLGWH